MSIQPDPRRRFNMADGLILTAALAATLAILRDAPDWSEFVFMRGFFSRFSNPPLALRVAQRASFVLIPWTVAVFLMGIRKPRPGLRSLVTRPGMAACGAAAVWLGLKTFLLALMCVGSPQKRFLVATYLGDGVVLVSWAAPAVAGAWLVLAVSGHWSPDRGWLDRSGRVLGASWLVLELLDSLRILF